MNSVLVELCERLRVPYLRSDSEAILTVRLVDRAREMAYYSASLGRPLEDFGWTPADIASVKSLRL